MNVIMHRTCTCNCTVCNSIMYSHTHTHTHTHTQSVAECVKYYYLCKKSENFKQIVRKANFKRKKPYFKQTDLHQPSSLSLLSTTHSLSHPPSFLEEKIKPESLTDNEPLSSQPTRVEPGLAYIIYTHTHGSMH